MSWFWINQSGNYPEWAWPNQANPLKKGPGLVVTYYELTEK